MRSEEEIIALLREKFSKGVADLGIGDDGAVFRNLVFTADLLVEGTHFTPEHPSFFLGRKSVSVNISDIASMGAEPLFILMTLALPPDLTDKWLDEFINGIYSACRDWGCSLVGGDLSSASQIYISVTAVGRTEKPVLRGKAKEGDWIYLLGDLGLSRAGREALEEKLPGFEALKKAFLDPSPPVRQALEASKIATSMIDVSDGFVLDLYRLLSGKGAVLAPESFNPHPQLLEFCKMKGADPIEYMLYGGEDYAIVYTSPTEGPGRKVGKVGGHGIYFGSRKLKVSGFTHFGRKIRKKF